MQIESPIGRRTFLQGAAALTAASAATLEMKPSATTGTC